ncbi:hypothetical protein [Thalassiella azotivora]
MSTPVRLVAYVAALAVAFAAALGLGAALDPLAAEPPAHADAADGGHATGPEPGADAAATEPPGGLLVAQDGYRLDLVADVVPAAASADLAFRVLGPDGEPVTAYTEAHEKDLHLVLVRRDLSGYQHVHPVMSADGTWTVPVDLSVPGAYRVLADFVPAGRDDGLVLGADLVVPGALAPEPLPAAAATTEVDGYTVHVDGGLRAGRESTLSFTVSRDGEPVTDLEPYLGSLGHLVALRQGDVAYLHVHPDDHGDEPADDHADDHADDATDDHADDAQVAFRATAPSPGTYRLYLDFQHDGVVRTAELTVELTEEVTS